MKAYFYIGICWIVILNLLVIRARNPVSKPRLAENGISGTSKNLLPLHTHKKIADRCRGYYDVMGQWDPPFNCNASSYLYCCGTCGYRFCCQFKHGRLEQDMCSNYDTPNWANTGKNPSRGEETADDSGKDKTNLIVYIICGIVAFMVLVGIFTKLVIEKTQHSASDMYMSRTMTDLLKQPTQVEFLSDGHRGSVQVQITEVVPRLSPRNSIENTTEDVFKKFQGVNATAASLGLHGPDSSFSLDSSILIPTKSNHKIKGSKTITVSGFQGLNSHNHDLRRHVYANKRQYSIEKLPQIFSQQGHYVNISQCNFSSNNKTEVTV